MARHLAFLTALGFALSLGCSGSGKSTSSNSTTTTQKKPRGWQAYSGSSPANTEDLGQAPDAAVGDIAGNAMQLSTLWAEQGVYLVFYRGDW